MLDDHRQSYIASCADNAITRVSDAISGAYTAPHVLMRPRVFLDSPGVWCAMYGDCLADSPAGFGDSPYAACSDFDRRWLYSQAQIDKYENDKKKEVPHGQA